MKKAGGIKKLAVGRKDLFLLAPEDIREEPGWNVRKETDSFSEGIRELANSIKEVGVLQPLTVYMDGESPVVTDGHRRLLAVKLAISEGADIKAVPVRTEERYCDEADRVLSMLTRNSGVPLTVPEQAEVVKRLLSFNWTEADIARKTGSTRQHVNTLVQFMALPVEVKQMVDAGEISATMAVNQTREEGPGAVDTLKGAVVKAKNEGKNKATAKHVRKKDPVKPIENYANKLPADQKERSESILEICSKLRELIVDEPTTDPRQKSLVENK